MVCTATDGVLLSVRSVVVEDVEKVGAVGEVEGLLVGAGEEEDEDKGDDAGGEYVPTAVYVQTDVEVASPAVSGAPRSTVSVDGSSEGTDDTLWTLDVVEESTLLVLVNKVVPVSVS